MNKYAVLIVVAFFAMAFGNDCNAQYYTIDTIAGNGLTSASTDGVAATSSTVQPLGIAVDVSGNVYVIDRNRLRRIDGSTGIITTVAGDGTAGFTGDGGPATAARINCGGTIYPNSPGGIFCSPSGDIYIADDGNGRIRKIDAATHIITTVAGGGSGGDGTPAVTALLSTPVAVATDVTGNLYIACATSLRKVDASTGIISTVLALPVTPMGPHFTDVKVDNAGNIYLEQIEFITTTIVKIDATTGLPATIVGGATGTPGLYGIPGSMVTFAAAAHYGLCLDRANNLYVGDGLYAELYRFDIATGLIYCAASSFGGGALLYVATDTFGNIYYSNRLYYVEKYTPQPVILTTFYVDHSDCAFNAGDSYNFLPVTAEIDSNGVPVDTVTGTSGIYYLPHGNPGDVYAIRLLSYPVGLVPACPSSGIMYDTLQAGKHYYQNNIGFDCSSATGFDLGIYSSLMARPGILYQQILAFNNYCAPHSATVTLTGTTKYDYGTLYPTPSATTGSVVTWDYSALSANPLTPVYMSILMYPPSTGPLVPGDTVHTGIQITAISGDADTTNNTIFRVDTVRGGFDPNFMDVSPEGLIPPDTTLQYTVHFENTGNDTAFNIYVIDTLSDNVDVSSLKVLASSAAMNVMKFRNSGHNVFKFEFRNINLPDSSHHGQCDGMFVFGVKTKAGLPAGTVIPNKAAIFFDANTPVSTNTVKDIIAIPTVVISGVTNVSTNAYIYPNPATNVLVIKTEANAFNNLTVTNSIGQVLLKQQLSTPTERVDVKTLPAGVYYITLKGPQGNVVQKFVKM